jgi:predicted enzyme related to lactoylglutathione lyase
MGNPTMWFEVVGKDQQALKGFYSQLFDWQVTDMEAMPSYSMVDTGGEEGIPGGIGVAPLGGTKVMGPMDIPSGQIALFTDPEGHAIGLMTQTG